VSPSYRRNGRKEDKGEIVEAGNRLTIAGLFALAVSIAAVVLLVADYIFDKTTAIATTAALGAVLAQLWIVLPLFRRLKNNS
jgi:predicted lysophospholipase L1 biosynthesis ABC-type transport system permease subunit